MATGTASELAPHLVSLAMDRFLILAVNGGRFHAVVYSPSKGRNVVNTPTADQFHWARNRDYLPQSQITDWHRCPYSADTLEDAVRGAMTDAYAHAEWKAVVGYIRSTAWGVDL